MKFAAHVLKEASEVGKESALLLSMPFEELELIQSNQPFLFENMAAIKNVSVVSKESESIDAVTGARMVADNAVPGKPSIIFH